MEENFIESRLSNLLKPVAPRPEFVQTIGSRIHAVRSTVVQSPTTPWKLLVLLASLLSLGVLLSLVGRGLFDLLISQKRQAG
jgi:hypothetical protein